MNYFAVCYSNSNIYLVMSPRWGSTTRLTDWLTVSRNVTSTSSDRRRSRQSSVWAVIRRSSFVTVEEKTLAVVARGSHWLWAVIIDYNCKEAPINPIIQSRTHYYYLREPRYVQISYLQNAGQNINPRAVSKFLESMSQFNTKVTIYSFASIFNAT
jgi:hypothetical protein